MPRLIVVSNRIGPIEEGKSAPGGLAVGVYDILRAMGGVWFGWSGEVADHTAAAPTLASNRNILYATVDLGRKDYTDYYAGYANSTLWPLLHFRTGLIDFRREWLVGYLRVNDAFAERLMPLLQPDDVIWVHDYHLIPLAAALRARGAKQRIGFFLHTPLPSRDVLKTLPDHARILRSFAAYDLIGFQTSDDSAAFEGYMVRELGAVPRDHRLQIDGRNIRFGVFPIGIETDSFARVAAVAAGQSATRRLIRSLSDRKLIIGVDRLDYSKGLPLRFRAIERLFKRHAEWLNRVHFLQIATLSRIDVRQYRDLRGELDSLAGSINGRYAEADWTPVRYVNKNVTRSTLAGYYRSSAVALVTPLRDGMNLVAKEYVAAQNPEDPGALILSQFAGAARELDAALQVNPFDLDAVADATNRALAMPLAERRERWDAMMSTLQQHTVRQWALGFMNALTGMRETSGRDTLAALSAGNGNAA